MYATFRLIFCWLCIITAIFWAGWDLIQGSLNLLGPILLAMVGVLGPHLIWAAVQVPNINSRKQ